MTWRSRYYLSTLLYLAAICNPAIGQVSECDALVNEAIRAGEVPGVTVDPKTKEVLLVTSKGTCVEAAGKWAARRMLSVPADVPRPAADEQKGAPPPRPAVAPVPKCDRILDGLWRPMHVRVGGEMFWLARVYTIDFDNDGRTDNLGFRLKSKRGEEVALRYFAEGGDVGANSLPELQLEDDRAIGRICFGELNLQEPTEVVMSPASGMSGMTSMAPPDLAAEARARTTGGAGAKPSASSNGAWSWLWAVLAGGAGLMLGAAGVLWYVTRRKAPSPAPGDDADEEVVVRPKHRELEAEEDEDEVPAKKKSAGLLGLLSGLMGRKKKPEAEEEEEEERHPPKPGHHPAGHKPGAHPPGKAAAPQRGRPAERPAKPSR